MYLCIYVSVDTDTSCFFLGWLSAVHWAHQVFRVQLATLPSWCKMEWMEMRFGPRGVPRMSSWNCVACDFFGYLDCLIEMEWNGWKWSKTIGSTSNVCCFICIQPISNFFVSGTQPHRKKKNLKTVVVWNLERPPKNGSPQEQRKATQLRMPISWVFFLQRRFFRILPPFWNLRTLQLGLVWTGFLVVQKKPGSPQKNHHLQKKP